MDDTAVPRGRSPRSGRDADTATLTAPHQATDPFASEHLPFLLGRELRRIPLEAGKEQIAGARALVTGAAGSVGRALVPRLLDLAPAIVVAVDTHEASLFDLGRGASRRLDLRVADVRNAAKIRRLFAAVQPDVVFHLAAYKHVPFGEREADEPVSVNVLGTDVVARAAAEAGVRHLVYPSSDKAVNPPSIYGATKRLAETLLLARAASETIPSIHLVRYVNITGSSGSALETFTKQARAGAPLTITDRRMTRYWMAMDEATGLLVHALGLPSGSRTLLDAGEPVAVVDMAERLFRLVRGDDARPEIVITGARAGERLFEELASASERLTPLGDEGVLSVESSRRPDAAAAATLTAEIEELLARPTIDALRERVMQLAAELQ